MKLIKYILLGLVLILVILCVSPVSQERLYPTGFNSIDICARNGELLRQVLSFDYKTSSWVPIKNIAPWVIAATVLREDKRFLFHNGVDILALARATWQNLRNGQIHSGGSTITMQVAKMSLNLKGRSFLNKILEMAYALKLELHLTKAQILEIYLNRAPYGNQTYGIEAAARLYFGKNAGQLSLGESCALALLPKAPSYLNPYVSYDILLKARSRLLRQFREQNVIDDLMYEITLKEPMNLLDREINFEAPHFVDYVLAHLDQDLTGAGRIITTLDVSLQKNIQKLLVTTLEPLKDCNVNQGAIVVMNAKNGEILAMVGSRDYFDAKGGQVNGCLSPRQPGSSIKPFLYALALQSGMRLSDILPDTLTEFRLADGTLFAPRDYGHQYHGPTRLREALASSFNVPAVYVIEQLGVQRFYCLLNRLRFSTINKGANHYGLSLSLGAAEVSLLELVNAYRVFASEGYLSDFHTILRVEGGRHGRIFKQRDSTEQVFSEEVAYLISDILSDNTSRFKAFGADNALHLPFPCAVKTGTSKDYRDNWCIGYTTDYIVGVWVGNFDGAPMQGVSGISGAAPLLRDVMLELHRFSAPKKFRRPSTLVQRCVCAHSGMIACTSCKSIVEETYIAGTEPCDTCDLHQPRRDTRYADEPAEQMQMLQHQLRIVNPSNGDIYKIDPQVSMQSQRVKFKISGCAPAEMVSMRLNGKDLGTLGKPFEYLWLPQPGKYTLEMCSENREPPVIEQVLFTVY
jgi:penicillin-binding protein 1C